MAKSHSTRDGDRAGAGGVRPPVATPRFASARVIVRQPANDNRRPVGSRIVAALISSAVLAALAGMLLLQLR